MKNTAEPSSSALESSVSLAASEVIYIALYGIIPLAAIALKLKGIIAWSWIQTLAFLWVPALMLCLMCQGVLIAALIYGSKTFKSKAK